MIIDDIKKYLKKIADFENEVGDIVIDGVDTSLSHSSFLTPNIPHSPVDAMILCATESEFEYFIPFIEGANYINDIGDPVVYCKGYISRVGRDLSVVLIVPTSMGIATAAINTTKAILKFSPRFIFMFGIIAGVGSGVNIGDIIIADKSLDYNEVVETQYADESIRTKYMHTSVSLSARLKADTYIFSKSGIVEILSNHDSILSRGFGVKVHFGLVVTGGQLQRNQEKITQLSRDYHNIKGLDMETYGVYRAAKDVTGLNPPEFISIKSVSDHGGNRKEKYITDSDIRRDVALRNASLFLHEFLKSENFRIM